MSTTNNIEYRTTAQPVEVNDRHVSGYAIVFDTDSVDLGGFTETIHRGAVTQDTINASDIFVRFNHNNDKILARCRNGEGSLSLAIDDKGLKYDFDAPHTANGDELLEHLKRGDLDSSSFAFTVDESDRQNVKYTRTADGLVHRDIYHIERLFDVAPVWQPAYEATTCSQRALEMVRTADEVAETNKKIIDEIKSL